VLRRAPDAEALCLVQPKFADLARARADEIEAGDPELAGRTTLKLFEIPEIACSAISEVLLHEVSACRPQNEPEMDCFPILSLDSKTSAKLVK
jgi:hypothetical protein